MNTSPTCTAQASITKFNRNEQTLSTCGAYIPCSDVILIHTPSQNCKFVQLVKIDLRHITEMTFDISKSESTFFTHDFDLFLHDFHRKFYSDIRNFTLGFLFTKCGFSPIYKGSYWQKDGFGVRKAQNYTTLIKPKQTFYLSQTNTRT